MTASMGLPQDLKDWLTLSRLPFHSVGIAPFFLGTFLAWRLEGTFSGGIFTLGTVAVMLIMLATYHAGEWSDVAEDRISRRLSCNRFAGGSGIMPQGRVEVAIPRRTSVIAVTLAAGIGVFLQFGLHTGPYTLVLGIAGGMAGFFYSTRPVRLVERGVGEIAIGFCYGWLPVATAFYLQTGRIDPIISWIAVPIALSIVNVILINEFPDYPADCAVGKRNLLVRTGRRWGAWIYAALAIGAGYAFIASILAGVPAKGLWLFGPIYLLSLILVTFMITRHYEDANDLEKMCGATILVNLATTASYGLAYV